LFLTTIQNGVLKENSEDTKCVIRNMKAKKKRHCNDHKKKDKQ
jgi:hypothetical protein